LSAIKLNLKKDYSVKGLIDNEEKIKNELRDNLMGHFENAVDNLEKIIKNIVGNKKESIASAVRRAELDSRITKFVKSRK
tara:strand:+ start:221 stop:460 length:240 start_codon:yes stop_codon:yes gene_type:complete